jgi:hypothetical protein
VVTEDVHDRAHGRTMRCGATTAGHTGDRPHSSSWLCTTSHLPMCTHVPPSDHSVYTVVTSAQLRPRVRRADGEVRLCLTCAQSSISFHAWGWSAGPFDECTSHRHTASHIRPCAIDFVLAMNGTSVASGVTVEQKDPNHLAVASAPREAQRRPSIDTSDSEDDVGSKISRQNTLTHTTTSPNAAHTADPSAPATKKLNRKEKRALKSKHRKINKVSAMASVAMCTCECSGFCVTCVCVSSYRMTSHRMVLRHVDSTCRHTASDVK